MEIRFHPAALTEVTEAQSWYQERSAIAAVGFAREIARVVRSIAEAPNRHPHAGHGTRRLLLRRYPFSLYYRIVGEFIEIVAVAHQKRRPGYWKTRSDTTELPRGRHRA